MYNIIRKEGGYLLCDLLHKCIIVWSITPISKRDEVVGDGVGKQRKGLLKHINAIAGVRRLVGIRRDPHKLIVAFLKGYPNCERSSVFGNHPTSRHRRPTARPYHSLYLDTSNDSFAKSKPKTREFVVKFKCYYIQNFENIQRQFVSTDIQVPISQINAKTKEFLVRLKCYDVQNFENIYDSLYIQKVPISQISAKLESSLLLHCKCYYMRNFENMHDSLYLIQTSQNPFLK